MNEYKLSKSEVLNYLGYKKQSMTGDLDLLIDESMSECLAVATPRYTKGFFDITVDNDTVILKNTNVIFKSSDIAFHLNGAAKCVLFAATLGSETEHMLIKYEKTNMTKAVIFDAACNALIESASDSFEEEIAAELAKSSLYINYRFSPGYGNFSIGNERNIIDLLSAEIRIGLTLNDSSLLIPQKSITAVIGVFNSPKSHEIGCRYCKNYNICNQKGGADCAV
ncbi:MAG: vitamin B12 dependent-methionine synthase activation domain-containing protein [Bacillota bacterium]|nr:vitamin B12 dependent-methionine synthase activation domain-containing protein [Bacillota bacterium]